MDDKKHPCTTEKTSRIFASVLQITVSFSQPDNGILIKN